VIEDHAVAKLRGDWEDEVIEHEIRLAVRWVFLQEFAECYRFDGRRAEDPHIEKFD